MEDGFVKREGVTEAASTLAADQRESDMSPSRGQSLLGGADPVPARRHVRKLALAPRTLGPWVTSSGPGLNYGLHPDVQPVPVCSLSSPLARPTGWTVSPGHARVLPLSGTPSALRCARVPTRLPAWCRPIRALTLWQACGSPADRLGDYLQLPPRHYFARDYATTAATEQEGSLHSLLLYMCYSLYCLNESQHPARPVHLSRRVVEWAHGAVQVRERPSSSLVRRRARS